MQLTPDLEALIDAVRESNAHYKTVYSVGYITNNPAWWFIPAVKEVHRETGEGLRESLHCVEAYVYARMMEGDEACAGAWNKYDEQRKWNIMGHVFEELI